MRVLVTGGGGFLGTRFAEHARAAAHAVVTLDRAGADLEVDVADAAGVAAAIGRAQPDVVVHLAAQLTDAGERDPVGAVRTNALGTAAVFAASEAAAVSRVVFASSNAAVGTSAADAGDDAILDPRSVYGVTKAFGEHLARAMSRRPGAPAYFALRFGWVYGPGRARGWCVPQEVIADALEARGVVTYPDYPEPIDWTYVDDAAVILSRALACPLDRYAAHNALGDRRRMRDAVAYLCKRFPGLVARPRDAAMPASAWRLVNDGLAQRIGTWHTTTLEEGIERMIEAHERATGAHASPTATLP